MFRVIAKRWWLILLIPILCLSYIGFRISQTKPCYIAITTLMPTKSSPNSKVIRARLRADTDVVKASLSELKKHGIELSPSVIANSVTLQKDTSVTSIRVSSPNSNTARIATEVISTQLKKNYEHKNGLILRTIDPPYITHADQYIAFRLTIVFCLITALWIGMFVGIFITVRAGRNR